jgi:predicted methyltransferase
MTHRLLVLALSAALAAPLAFAHNHGGDAKPTDAAAHDAHEQAKAALDAAIAGEWRDPANVARDRFRNPGPTLAFFGITPGMTVIEMTPGGGWYAEILAPYLRDGGRYLGAVNDPAKASNERANAYFTRQNQALRDKFAAKPEVFGKASLVEIDPAAPVFGEAGSADAVLTFRNVHNWMMGDQEAGMFKGFFDVLKPGGVLGVVEHRAKADVPDGDRSGYVSEAQVIAMAQAAGFVLEAKSEVNANPKDDGDHPNGVWTLPPTLNVPEGEDKAAYEAIGESDRMTLRFRKPQP